MNEVVVFGASGYSGLELLRILSWHPEVRVVAASSDRWADRSVSDAVPGWPTDLRFSSHRSVLEHPKDGQVALLATPAETSAELAPRLLDAGVRVVDLSGAFRLPDPSTFREWYGFEHPSPQLLGEAHFGLAELLPVPPSTRLVANPGCYATASLLTVAPAVKAGLLKENSVVIVDGKSGTTGAGRSLKDELLHAEVTENLRAYGVAKHRHTPEIERALGLVAGRAPKVSFTAHLIPMRRGILVSTYLTASEGLTETSVRRAYEQTYGAEPFVRLVDRPPQTAAVRDSNLTEIGWTLDTRTGLLCAFGAIDNLVKGAAGQAVQNMNQLLSLPSHMGMLPSNGVGR